jgi:uncharacterized protein YbjT (DUF2867 family)
LDGAQGRRLVALCEQIAERAGVANPPARPQPSSPAGTYDVLVIGGTGFIGRPVVAALLERGNRVAVLARNTANLPPLFLDQRVGVVRGDVTNNDDLRKAMEGVSAVVNLAHAGGADSWPEVERRIVGGARRVAELCLEKGVKQLVHASTIAALYLGDGGETITGETQPDPNADRRAVYSRAKALAERELMRMRDEQGLPVTILRPGVVIGDGTSPFHSGIGLYNRDSIASAGMPAPTNCRWCSPRMSPRPSRRAWSSRLRSAAATMSSGTCASAPAIIRRSSPGRPAAAWPITRRAWRSSRRTS